MLKATKLSTRTAVLSRQVLNSARSRPAILLQKRLTSNVSSTATEEATTKKGGAVGKTILTLTLLSAAGYSGGVYYSMKSEAFRDSFTTYIWGAEEVLDNLEQLAQNEDFRKYREQATELKDKTVAFGKTAAGYAKTVKDSTIDAYEYVSDLVGKVSSKVSPAPPVAPVESPVDSVAKLNELNVLVDTEPEPELEVESSTPEIVQVEPVVEKPSVTIDLISHESNDPIITQLFETLNELVSILNETGLAEQGVSIIDNARKELAQLSDRFDLLQADQITLVQTTRALAEDSEKLQDLIDLQHREAIEKLVHQKSALEESFNAEKASIQEAFNAKLADELDTLRREKAAELNEALVSQAIELKRRWIREVKLRVEHERAGRLAKLDYIMSRLKTLERISLNNVERLDQSTKGHQLWVAVQALRYALEQPYRAPFIDELEALRDVASTHPLITAVIASIPDRVSEHGVDSLSDLTARFKVVREEVRRASLVPEDGGFVSHVVSIVLSKFMFRKEGLVKGDDVEAILARVEWYLRENDLDSATRELNQLGGWPKKLAADWIDAARRHLEVKQALEVVETQASLLSLLQA